MDDCKNILIVIMKDGNKHIKGKKKKKKKRKKTPLNLLIMGKWQESYYNGLDELSGHYRHLFKERLHCHQCHNSLQVQRANALTQG